ncbi:hypothetical protein ACQ4M3_38845 [Leptolyngbya sp. AN03gr2]|uniref:hypothetical protein n=1 Tax=unclassified Leptolyngbya TaxID=2650499 RepID=UPI003D313401
MTIALDLAAHQTLRQRYLDYIELQLGELHTQVAQQLEDLKINEHPFLIAQLVTLDRFRSQIERDARCLLGTDGFVAQMAAWREDCTRCPDNELELDADLSTWRLHTLPFPVQVLQHRLVTDNWAYNDENHYTEYRYELDVQLGTWLKTVSGSIAHLSPGEPMSYGRMDFRSQQYEIAYCLKSRQRYNEPPVLEWEELNWTVEQERQLKQELSCLLAFVGDLFVVRSEVETFRYPMQRRSD